MHSVKCTLYPKFIIFTLQVTKNMAKDISNNKLWLIHSQCGDEF
jgi:hypothetical protein